jgi:hypothetical protein
MEINYCLKKGKGKGNLYLPSFVVTLFCRRALMSSRSYVAALLCRRALMSPRSYVARSFVARSFCGALLSRYPNNACSRLFIQRDQQGLKLLAANDSKIFPKYALV